MAFVVGFLAGMSTAAMIALVVAWNVVRSSEPDRWNGGRRGSTARK